MAKRFKFDLETVLRVRHIEAEQAKKEFALAMQAALKVEQEIDAYLDLVSKGKGLIAEMMQVRIDVTELRLQKQYLFGLGRKINEAEGRLQNLAADREQKRVLLMTAMQKERAMELLKEKRFKSYQYALDKEEQSVLDDVKNLMNYDDKNVRI